MLIDLDRQPNFAALLGLAWLLVALVLLLVHWPQTAETLLDTDDAMRLVEMRAWLNGPGLLSGWYDLHQSRLQPPDGVDMHWSRLIDAGLAGCSRSSACSPIRPMPSVCCVRGGRCCG
ncbi:MAG: hypothetical protein ABWY66_00380 [Xanthobacteraceae bacterium]|jgi:hypothetical protein